MTNIEKQIAKLGRAGTDKVTRFNGVVTSVSFDLYGCIQLLLNPGLDKDGKLQEQQWFDSNRIALDPEGTPYMPPPNFVDGREADGDKGPAEKPASIKP